MVFIDTTMSIEHMERDGEKAMGELMKLGLDDRGVKIAQKLDGFDPKNATSESTQASIAHTMENDI